MKQKRKKTALSEALAPAGESFKKLDRRLLLFEIVMFILVFTIYQTACYYSFKPIVHIYSIIIGVLFILVVIFNRGLSRVPTPPENLPEDWDEERKTQYIDKEKKSRDTAKKLIMILIPFIFTFLIDMIYLFVTVTLAR